MKKIFFLLLPCLILITSCGLNKEGKVSVEDGEGNSIKIPYAFYDYKDFLKEHHTQADFKDIVRKSNLEAIYSCRNKLTYIPKKISFLYEKGDVTTLLVFEAKNGFGVPIENKAGTYYRGITFDRTVVASN